MRKTGSGYSANIRERGKLVFRAPDARKLKINHKTSEGLLPEMEVIKTTSNKQPKLPRVTLYMRMVKRRRAQGGCLGTKSR